MSLKLPERLNLVQSKALLDEGMKGRTIPSAGELSRGSQAVANLNLPSMQDCLRGSYLVEEREQ